MCASSQTAVGRFFRIGLVPVALFFSLRADDAPGLKVWGSLYNDLLLLQNTELPLKKQFDFAGNGRLTLNAANRHTAVVKVDASADLIVLYGRLAELAGNGTPVQGGTGGMRGPVLFDLRKLYAALFTGPVDLFIGRQIVNFGVGRIYSPIDVFSSVDVYDLAYRRSGSDVVRLRLPFGPASGLELVAGLANPRRAPAAAVKAHALVKGLDLAATVIYQGDDKRLVAGLSARGDLVVGLSTELVEKLGTDGRHHSFEALLGADYSWQARWFFNAEYLFCEQVPHMAQSSGVVAMGGGGQGMHNVFGSVRYVFNELVSAGLSGMGTPDRKLGFVMAQGQYNVLQNADLILFVRHMHYGRLAQSNQLPSLQYGLRVSASF